jgi:hypothetical protein
MLCLLTVVIMKVMLRLLSRLTVEAGLPSPARSGGANAALPPGPAAFRHRATGLRRLRSWPAARPRGREDGTDAGRRRGGWKPGTWLGAGPGGVRISGASDCA